MSVRLSIRSRDAESLTLEEKLRAIDEFEGELARDKKIPNERRLLMSRLRPLFTFVAAAILGLSVSMISLVAVFLLFNKVLHIEP